MVSLGIIVNVASTKTVDMPVPESYVIVGVIGITTPPTVKEISLAIGVSNPSGTKSVKVKKSTTS